MEYIQLSFAVTGTPREILIARLSEIGFEGFEEHDENLLASVSASGYNEADVEAIATASGLSFSKKIIKQENWNALWEASFEPVVVPGFCTVRASFHPPATETEYEIVITPKMSFGTGHHATTRLMMQAMKDLDMASKQVLDFGTGTGILAILASKLGADKVIGIDNDEWSTENARENITENGSDNVEVSTGSLESIGSDARFDVILANINRHILLRYMQAMRNMLKENGVLLLSGILKADEPIIAEAGSQAGFTYRETLSEGDWIAIKFTA